MSKSADDANEWETPSQIQGKSDRRESYRTDVPAHIQVEDEAWDVEGNVSLGGFFIPAGQKGADMPLGTQGRCELRIPESLRQPDEPATLLADVVAAPVAHRRPGRFLEFQGLSFEDERRIARLLDFTHPE